MAATDAAPDAQTPAGDDDLEPLDDALSAFRDRYLGHRQAELGEQTHKSQRSVIAMPVLGSGQGGFRQRIRAYAAEARSGPTPDDASLHTTTMCMKGSARSMRTSVLFDDELAAEAGALGIIVSEAAREGLRQVIRRRRAERDRAAYLAYPETEDADWDEAESWGEA